MYYVGTANIGVEQWVTRCSNCAKKWQYRSTTNTCITEYINDRFQIIEYYSKQSTVLKVNF